MAVNQADRQLPMFFSAIIILPESFLSLSIKILTSLAILKITQ
jgi:hypothetical protein